MKFQTNEILNGKYTTRKTTKSVFLVPFTLLLIMFPLILMRNTDEPSPNMSSVKHMNNKTETKGCDIFSGNWIPHSEGPYYNNVTCKWMIDEQNCMKFGRPDDEYLRWRWKPNECELPLFNATQFLELVRGKKMVFVGDSVGRNQLQSLLCLLSQASQPEDVSHKYTTNVIYFKRYFFSDYNFTLGNLWSPYFVRSKDADKNGHSYNSIMKLYVDEVDEAWSSQVENFDIVIISAGHWFFRPLLFYKKGQLVGCNKCGMENVTDLAHYYGYKMAFRTAFRTLTNLENFKGVTFFRTFSPSHFENGDWNKGGNCVRTKPFSKEEMNLNGYILETYLSNHKERERPLKTSSMAVKLYIVYYSMYGHVEKLAEEIKKGAASVEGVEAKLWQVPETLQEEVLGKMSAPPKSDVPLITPNELSEGDGFVFGFPTRFGMMAAQFKAFLDATGGLWKAQSLAGKPAGIFYSTGSQGGGQETTALTAITQLVHHGMIFVPIGYTFGAGMFEMEQVKGGSPYGAGTYAGDGSRQPSELELQQAFHQGKYLATITKKLKEAA